MIKPGARRLTRRWKILQLHTLMYYALLWDGVVGNRGRGKRWQMAYYAKDHVSFAFLRVLTVYVFWHLQIVLWREVYQCLSITMDYGWYVLMLREYAWYGTFNFMIARLHHLPAKRHYTNSKKCSCKVTGIICCSIPRTLELSNRNMSDLEFFNHFNFHNLWPQNYTHHHHI